MADSAAISIEVPKKINMLTAGGFALVLVGQLVVYVTDRTEVRAELTALQRNDAEARQRGDDIRRRLGHLEDSTKEVIALRVEVKGIREAIDKLDRKLDAR